jgi:hypothetical protein
MIPSPMPKGETSVAGAIETLDPEINVICLMVADIRRGAGDRADELSTRERETETRVFDIADGRG